MNLEISGVAERLAREFPGLPAGIVMRTVCECADACDCAGALFIEQAARAVLVSAAGPPGGPPETFGQAGPSVAPGGVDLGLGEEQAAAQVGAGEVGVAQVGTGQVGPAQVGIPQVGAEQERTP